MTDQFLYLTNLFLQLTIGTFFFYEIGTPKRGIFFISISWTALFYGVHIFFTMFEVSAFEELLQTIMKCITFFIVMTFFFKDSIRKKIRMSVAFLLIFLLPEPILILILSIIFGLHPSDFYSQNFSDIIIYCGKLIAVDILLILAAVFCIFMKRKNHITDGMFGLWQVFSFTLLHIVFITVFFAVNKNEITYRTIYVQIVFQTLLIIMAFIQHVNSKSISELIRSESEIEKAKMELESNKDYYDLAKNKYNAITSLQKHLNAHLVKAESLLASENGTEEVVSIIDDIRDRLDEMRAVNFCANRAVNSVLTIKLEDEKMSTVMTDIDLCDCEELPLDEYDLCSIVVNLFDNAVNCCLKLPEETERYVELKSKVKNGFFIVRCINPCPYSNDTEAPDISEGHGYGLKILEKLCRKYNGEFTLRYKDGKAIATAAVSVDTEPKKELFELNTMVY